MKGLGQIIRDNNDAYDRARPYDTPEDIQETADALDIDYDAANVLMAAAEIEELNHTCPYCSGYGVLLGQLGHIEHLKCRSCGFLFNNDVEREL